MAILFRKILIVGKTPPPIGGVSIHVARLLKKLNDDHIFYDFLNYKSFFAYRYFFDFGRVCHVHLSNKWFRLFIVLMLKGFINKVIVTFHGKYDFGHMADRIVLRLCDDVILLNNFSYNSAKIFKKEGIHLIGAFIPPTEIVPLRADMNVLIEKLKKDVNVICCVNASIYAEDENGRDIYMGAEIVDFFKKNKNLGLIFSDPSGAYKAKFGSIQPRNILFMSEDHDFVSVLLKSDVFIRATRKDGDSISVKEALFMNKKVIATGCVERPAGVLIINDLDDIVEIIDKPIEVMAKPRNNFYEISALYKKYILK